ncbi:hypothetical protein EMCRGX_G034584 [Ephydatia muelleri]|eukprot:Em0023g483a
MDSLKKAFSKNEQTETEAFLSAIDVKKLGWKNRIIGFSICVGLAALFAILGCGIAYVSVAAFAVLFSVATICGVASTFFIVGPINQVLSLFDRGKMVSTIIRIVAIVILLFCVVMAFLLVFLWSKGGVAILFCIFQFLAIASYGITFLPFAEQMIKTCFKTTGSMIGVA